MFMKKSIVSLLCLASAGVAFASELEVKPLGMQVVWDPAKDAQDGFSTYNRQESGLEVAALLTSSDQVIVSADMDASSFDGFFAAGKKSLAGEFGWNKNISKDGKNLKFTIESKKLPAGEISALTAKGVLHIQLGSEKEKFTTEMIEMSPGKEGKLGEMAFELSKLGKPSWGDAVLEITLKSKQSFEGIAEYRFFDENDKPVSFEEAGSGSMGFMGKKTYSKTFTFKTKPKKMRVEADMWSDLSTVEQPFELSLSPKG